jgi:hypothetical protein
VPGAARITCSSVISTVSIRILLPSIAINQVAAMAPRRKLLSSPHRQPRMSHQPPASNRSWVRNFFEDHPKLAQRSSEAFSGTGSVQNKAKVFCKPCLAHRINQILCEDDLQVKDGIRQEIRPREMIVLECVPLQFHFRDTVHDYFIFSVCSGST